MTDDFQSVHQTVADQGKPRIVLMGEFSSGKSTLSNILLGGPILPTQVTATRLPPVFVTYGTPGAYAISRQGERVPVDLSDLTGLTPEAFSALHVSMISGMLELCDLVDMPGISDPNMPVDTWDSVIGSTDHVLWCTHATQAWRQSESAMWDRLRGATAGRNLLLITQIDKLRTPRDRARVEARVAAETSGKFTGIFPVALLDALAAGEDFDLWQQSGAHVLMEHLIGILVAQEEPFVQEVAPVPTPVALPQDTAHDLTDPVQSNIIEIPRQRRRTAIAHAPGADLAKGKVRPRRVQARSDRAERPVNVAMPTPAVVTDRADLREAENI